MRIAAIVLFMAATMASAQTVHSVCDISKEFLFYFDGRFATQYLPGASDARNWGTLARLDLSNTNLLVLQQGDTPIAWPASDIAAVRRFVVNGGGVVVLGASAGAAYHLNELARDYGVEFADQPAKEPFVPTAIAHADRVQAYGTKVLSLKQPPIWEVVVSDSTGAPMMVRRKLGRGRIMFASRGLFGQNPDASDPINATWIQPQMKWLAAGKAVDPANPTQGQQPELAANKGGLTLRYSSYLADCGDAVVKDYQRCYPVLQEILGVPPSKGMLLSLELLPTGGGGFSSGDLIGLGVWWGGFPQEQYPMVELIGHESTHSWVLPYPEPMWNEGLATYVGMEVGRRLGYGKEADDSLRSWLAGAEAKDPGFQQADIAKLGLPGEVSMGKPMWIWQQLEKKYGADLLKRYFQAKRKLILAGRPNGYTADDCVAVLSVAAGEDLFPWFQSIGTSVDRSRTDVAMP